MNEDLHLMTHPQELSTKVLAAMRPSIDGLHRRYVVPYKGMT